MNRQQWIMQNPHVCVLPYSTHHIQIEFNGSKDPLKQSTVFRNSCCCNLITDTITNDINFLKADLAEDVRQSMQAEKLNPRCKRCHDAESQTKSSERTMALMSMPDREFNDFIKASRVEQFNLRIKFSNLCNLACRSCSPAFSSKYAQLHNLTVPKTLTQDIGSNKENWQWITTQIHEYLKQYSSINIVLLGGESTIQPGALKLIEWCKQQNIQSKISLSFTTNMTMFDVEILSKLKDFKKLQISASIDSIGNNYRYVRYPANFDLVVNNINTVFPKLIEHEHWVVVQPLLNLNNIFYINDILDWWQQWFTTHQINSINIDPVMMYRPEHMTVQNLPVEYRYQLATIIEKSLGHPLLVDHHPGLKTYLTGLLEFCNTTTSIHNQFELYLLDTAKHDLASGLKMQENNHRLWNIMSDNHKNILETFYRTPDRHLLPEKQQLIFRALPL